jgi:hypothetical protein
VSVRDVPVHMRRGGYKPNDRDVRLQVEDTFKAVGRRSKVLICWHRDRRRRQFRQHIIHELAAIHPLLHVIDAETDSTRKDGPNWRHDGLRLERSRRHHIHRIPGCRECNGEMPAGGRKTAAGGRLKASRVTPVCR